jgi:6,7-dimethyl-8-ribityllumazine synthase
VNKRKCHIGNIITEFLNENITAALLHGAEETLKRHGAKPENIITYTVPGSFELIYGSSKFIQTGMVDAVIALGCVVRGDTPHFDYVCAGTTQGISELNALGNIPVIFGLITTDTMQQAEDRAGGIHGNKGDECAITAIKMVDLAKKLKK